MSEAANKTVLIVENDLMFSVRMETMLRNAGYDPIVVGSAEEAESLAGKERPALVIVNFGSDRIAAAQLTRHIKSLPDPPPVLGFVPHVWLPQVRPNAIGAGCDLLVANSALVRRLPQLAARLAPLDGTVASVAEAAALTGEEDEA